jgi:putative oxidoreductase
MFQALRGPLTVLGRLLLCTIFLMAAVGNKIPHFSEVAKIMGSVGVPAPQFKQLSFVIPLPNITVE